MYLDPIIFLDKREYTLVDLNSLEIINIIDNRWDKRDPKVYSNRLVYWGG